ncbi:MAG: hypothetical protein WD404_06210 [Solirubrobacterales bacterium]
MSEPREIVEPGELVYRSRPSWAPLVFAFSAAVAVCGIFAQGFMFRGWVWSLFAIVVLLFALRAMVKGAVRDYFRLPRKQRTRGAVLPVERIKFPSP